MIPLKTVRASLMALADICPPAAQPPEVRIDTAGPEARLGSAVHEPLASWISLGRTEVDVEQLEAAALKWGVNADEVATLAGMAWGMWQRELKQWFPNPQTEVEMVGDILTGHADVLAVVEV